MPSADPERSAEAVRRALPELLKLDRYERRATARRDRAMSRDLQKNARGQPIAVDCKNEANFLTSFHGYGSVVEITSASANAATNINYVSHLAQARGVQNETHRRRWRRRRRRRSSRLRRIGGKMRSV